MESVLLIDLSVYAGLFGAAFLAATLLPAQSELVLSGLVVAGEHPLWVLILVASIGNTLGAAVNWYIGYHGTRLLKNSRFSISPEKMHRANRWYRKYGRWSLLMSWAPIIGDPLTLIAGVLKEPFRSAMSIILVAKTARYVIVAIIALKGLEYVGSAG